MDLKKEWGEFKASKFEEAQEEHGKFMIEFPQDDLEELTLDKYTGLKENDRPSYFTYWLERKTEACGKFRTASSYSYGVYRVKDPIKKSDEVSKDPKYRTFACNKEKKSNNVFTNRDDAEAYFEGSVRKELVSVSKCNDEPIAVLDINYCRKVAYLYNPSKFLSIYKAEVIKSIADYFDVEVDSSSYKATELILEAIVEKFEIDIDEENGFEITQKLSQFLRKRFGESFLLDSKNMILHGAPGTGKTYAVETGIKQRMLLEMSEEEVDAHYKLVQFHPSFGYEEFIDGIKPAGITDGQMSFKLVNGIFKQMCIDAAKELVLSKETENNPKNFYFIADEINRAELSRVFGEVLLCLEEDKRLIYLGEGKWGGTRVKTLNSGLWSDSEGQQDYVIKIGDETYFGVPENLYFIGTMNDIDRSVDSFDMALRRRFVWKHYQCDYDVITEKYTECESIEKYINACKSLNSLIMDSKNDGFGLGGSFQLGHAYFMKPKTINKSQLTQVWESSIKPLLREYLRAEVPMGEIENHLKTAKKCYVYL